MQAERIVGLAERNAGVLLIAALAVILLLLVVNIWMMWRLRRLGRNYRRLTTGTSGENLEQVLHEHLDQVTEALQRTETVAATCQELERRLERCVQRVGFQRFDAFEDVGGQLSFALALLDNTGNGVVLTSLHARQETRFYAKPIRDGQCSYPLTTEETEVLREAGWEVTAPRHRRDAR